MQTKMVAKPCKVNFVCQENVSAWKQSNLLLVRKAYKEVFFTGMDTPKPGLTLNAVYTTGKLG